jgi:hypothetical protein
VGAVLVAASSVPAAALPTPAEITATATQIIKSHSTRTASSGARKDFSARSLAGANRKRKRPRRVLRQHEQNRKGRAKLKGKKS